MIKKFLLGGLLSIITWPALACVHSVSSTPTFVEVCISQDVCKLITFDLLPNGDPAKPATVELVRASLQTFLDVRLPLTILPLGDPDRGCSFTYTDSLFCGDVDGVELSGLTATYLISRGCEITSINWDGTTYALTISATN